MDTFTNENMRVSGLEVDSPLHVLLEKPLLNLLSVCPYQSYIVLDIEKMVRRYKLKLEVHFGSGSMEAISDGVNLQRATLTAVNRIKKQIEGWRKSRFEEVAPAGPPLLTSPIAVSAPVEATKAEFSPLVLIIDDDLSISELLNVCLTQSGCRTKFVANGMAAVDELATRRYDLVFLDWNMPEMNGRETLLSAENAILYDPVFSRHFSGLPVPVVTFSALPRKDIELPNCRSFRFVDHWEKSTPFPRMMNQLEDVLFRFKSGRNST